MAYDPNFPPDHSALNAAPFRTQFQGLKSIADTKVNTADLTAAIQAESSGSIAGTNYLSLSVSNPPTQAEVQAIADKVDELIALLKRQ